MASARRSHGMASPYRSWLSRSSPRSAGPVAAPGSRAMYSRNAASASSCLRWTASATPRPWWANTRSGRSAMARRNSASASRARPGSLEGKAISSAPRLMLQTAQSGSTSSACRHSVSASRQIALCRQVAAPQPARTRADASTQAITTEGRRRARSAQTSPPPPRRAKPSPDR